MNTKQITEQNIIGEIVAENYKTASVFAKYKIDFCCKGNRSIEDACKQKEVNISNLISELNKQLENSDSSYIFDLMPLNQLIDYIIKNHHQYVEEQISVLNPFLTKLVSVHGIRHPELAEIKQLFNKSAEELTLHMKKEELVLFPYINKLATVTDKNSLKNSPIYGKIEQTISVMQEEHIAEGNYLSKINQLTNGYTPPNDGCTTYRVTFEALKDFESNTHLHIHLENNILFPKAIQKEHHLLN